MGRHYAKKADSNQPDLVKYLRGRGATFQHTHQIAGALDGIVGFAGIDQRVEIKDPTKPKRDRQLTDKEATTFREWKGRPPVVIETSHDCEQLLSQLSQEAGRARA